jgi:hypothetical protein
MANQEGIETQQLHKNPVTETQPQSKIMLHKKVTDITEMPTHSKIVLHKKATNVTQVTTDTAETPSRCKIVLHKRPVIDLVDVIGQVIQNKLTGGVIDPIKVYVEKNLHVSFFQVFTPDEAQLIFNYLSTHVQWPKTATPNRRYNCTYGDDGLVYEIQFGAKLVRRSAIPWSQLPHLIKMNQLTTRLTCDPQSFLTSECKYNFCVIQCYPQGKIGINPHRDKEMTRGTSICGWSFGCERMMTLSSSRLKKSIKISLPTGSLYVLHPPTNDYWTHCIEKCSNDLPRYSLTFRNYVI